MPRHAVYARIRPLKMTLFLLLTVLLSACQNDYQSGKNYASTHPPKQWSQHYPLCQTGGYQSPIAIQSANVQVNSLPPLLFKFSHHDGWLVNDGYTAKILFVPLGNTLTIGNDHYTLQNVHFHTPSENSINGKSYPMVVHWVYQSQGKWVVVAVFAQVGAANSLLTKLWHHLPTSPGKTPLSGTITGDFSHLLPNNRRAYYRFEGSLTTPPCSRHISWYLLKQPIHASQQQINLLHHYFGNNVRPIQPLNQRLVESTG